MCADRARLQAFKDDSRSSKRADSESGRSWDCGLRKQPVPAGTSSTQLRCWMPGSSSQGHKPTTALSQVFQVRLTRLLQALLCRRAAGAMLLAIARDVGMSEDI